MKLYMDPIDVETDHNRRPECIRWHHTTFHVRQIEDYWIFCGKWWQSEEKRYYLRTQTDRGVLEIFRRDGNWILSRVLD